MSRGNLAAAGRVVLLFVIGAMLQTLLVSRVSVLGVTADLFLILTILVGISKGSLQGAVFGFVLGVVADTAYMQPLGMRALVYVVTGYFVGTVVGRFSTVSPWAVFLITVGASFCSQCVFGIVQFVIGPRAGFLSILGLQILPEAILDGLVAIPVFVLLIHLTILPHPRTQPVTAKAEAE